MQFDRNVVTFGLKTPFHVLGKRNGTKTELYRTKAKSQDLVPALFALIIIIVACACTYSKTSISITKYIQKAGEPENDAVFLKSDNNCCSACSQLNYNYSYLK